LHEAQGPFGGQVSAHNRVYTLGQPDLPLELFSGLNETVGAVASGGDKGGM